MTIKVCTDTIYHILIEPVYQYCSLLIPHTLTHALTHLHTHTHTHLCDIEQALTTLLLLGTATCPITPAPCVHTHVIACIKISNYELRVNIGRGELITIKQWCSVVWAIT